MWMLCSVAKPSSPITISNIISVNKHYQDFPLNVWLHFGVGEQVSQKYHVFYYDSKNLLLRTWDHGNSLGHLCNIYYPDDDSDSD